MQHTGWLIAGLSLSLAGSLAAQPRINTILTPSMEPDFRIAPGGIVIIQGTGFSAETRLALVPPLPKELAGAQVLINGLRCPLLMVSPETIHAQVPFGLTTDHPTASVYLSIKSGEVQSNELEVKLQQTHPFLVTQSRDGKGPVLQLDRNLRPLNGAVEGERVVLYATGLGITAPPATDGMGGSAEAFQDAQAAQYVIAPTDVFIGDAKVAAGDFDVGNTRIRGWARLAPGLPGVYELKITAPAGAAGQKVRLVTEASRETGADWVAAAAPAEKFTGLTGQIDAPFPDVKTPGGWSPILIGAKFSLSMTLTRQSQPIEISLEGEVASVKITVRPADGVFTGTAVVPMFQTRTGNFGGTEIQVMDLLNAGLPMPGNIVPASRIPPECVQALNTFPAAGAPLPDRANGTLSFAGQIPNDGRLVLSEATTPSAFGTLAWKAISDTKAKTYSTTFRLMVDGKELASRQVTIPVQ